MDTTIVRYKVNGDQAEENKAYIRAVFEELDANKPEGLRYVSFCLADGVTFVHIAVVEAEDGENPLQVASSADIIGSYRLFWQKLADTA
jgi:hypothetical protein